MGIAERKQRQKEEQREDLLNAAWQIVREEGWQSLSIRKIADAIEYSVPIVYEHFDNKEALLFEFNKKGFQLLFDKISETKKAYAEPEKQLEAIAYAYWEFAFDNKEYYQLMFGLGMPNCEQVKKLPEIMAFTELVKMTIEQVCRQTGNTNIDSFLKVHSFWSMLHGLVSINLVTPPKAHNGISSDDMNRMVLNDFIKGFLKGLDK